MPRPKVTEELRRRIAKACLYCQATKQKCDGLTPCSACSKRDRSTSCAYSSHVRSYGAHRRRRSKPAENPGQRSVDLSATSSPHDGISSQLQHSKEAPPQVTSVEVPIPKLSHKVYDTNGRVVYLGDCAALSFLRHIQEIVEGEGASSTDVSSVLAMEELRPHPDVDLMTERLWNTADLEELLNVFFASTCGILDIIERHKSEDLLRQLMIDPECMRNESKAVVFLVLAYAAQARSSSVLDYKLAQHFYHHGRQIALLELTDEPRLETVQAFLLLCLYMLACSQRNGAYLQLGIAISAAKSLGMHRDMLAAENGNEDSYLRRRIWRTLCYHDVHFCAMMGRTPSTITTDSAPFDSLLLPSNFSGKDSGQQLALLESARAFTFMQRTVTDIYTKRSVSLGLLQQLAQELQQASSKIPSTLRIVTPSDVPSQLCVNRNAMVACNYYFSMMVLSRPFLITCIHTKLNRTKNAATDSTATRTWQDDDHKIHNDIMQGAMTSIDAATFTVQLLHDLLMADMLFNNMPLPVAWVFVSALTICSAYFGRIGNLCEMEKSIQQADEILAHFSKHSRQGKRYGLILKKLSKAAAGHLQAVKHRERQSRGIMMPELFRPNLPASKGVTGLSSQALGQSHGRVVEERQDPSGFSFLPSIESMATRQGPPPDDSPSELNNTSLLNLVQSYTNSDDFFATHNYNFDGHPNNLDFNLDEAADIWDLNWGGSLL